MHTDNQLPMNKLVILDRDGVINEDSDAYIKSVAEWTPVPGSLEGIAKLTEAGFRIVVASNQSGLGRGLFDQATLDEIHAHMHDRVADAGGHLEAVFYCPHHPDEGCQCRKPQPGLLEQIERELAVSVVGAYFVGDTRKDLEVARSKGAIPILVRSGKGERTIAAGDDTLAERVCDNLLQAAEYLLEREKSGA